MRLGLGWSLAAHASGCRAARGSRAPRVRGRMGVRVSGRAGVRVKLRSRAKVRQGKPRAVKRRVGARARIRASGSRAP